MYKRKMQGILKHYDFILIDEVCLQIALFLSYHIRHGLGVQMYAVEFYRNSAILLAMIDLLVIMFFDTMKDILRRSKSREFYELVRQSVLTAVGFAVYLYLSRQSGLTFSRTVYVLTFVFYTFFNFGGRLVWRRVLHRRMAEGTSQSLLIIAASENAEEVVRRVQNNNFEFMKITGVVLVDEAEADCPAGSNAEKDKNSTVRSKTEKSSIAADSKTDKCSKNSIFNSNEISQRQILGVPVVCGRREMYDYVLREWVDEILIALPEDTEQKKIDRMVRTFVEMGIPVHQALKGQTAMGGKPQILENFGSFPVVTTSLKSATPWQLFLKRLLDIVGGIVGCILTGVFAIIFGPAIRIKSPGPIFYSQVRVGRNGKKFRMYKFRTMNVGADKQQESLQAENKMSSDLMFKMDWDPRIIGAKTLPDGTHRKGIGNFLRDTSIDEFPQFFNVLLGQMSLVGTRPPTESEWERYKLQHRARLAIKPGITGLWQVSGRSNITDFNEVVKLDTTYIDNWSLGLDIQILFKTIAVVFKREGSM